MSAKTFILGVVLGMASAIILTETCPAVKHTIADCKRKLKKAFNNYDD